MPEYQNHRETLDSKVSDLIHSICALELNIRLVQDAREVEQIKTLSNARMGISISDLEDNAIENFVSPESEQKAREMELQALVEAYEIEMRPLLYSLGLRVVSDIPRKTSIGLLVDHKNKHNIVGTTGLSNGVKCFFDIVRRLKIGIETGFDFAEQFAPDIEATILSLAKTKNHQLVFSESEKSTPFEGWQMRSGHFSMVCEITREIFRSSQNFEVYENDPEKKLRLDALIMGLLAYHLKVAPAAREDMSMFSSIKTEGIVGKFELLKGTILGSVESLTEWAQMVQTSSAIVPKSICMQIVQQLDFLRTFCDEAMQELSKREEDNPEIKEAIRNIQSTREKAAEGFQM